MHQTTSKAWKRFNYLSAEIGAAYHDMSYRLGLSDSAMQILYTICDCGQDGICPLQTICRQTGLAKQTVNSALRKLETEGILYLEPVGTKGKNICLTDAGKQLAENTAVRMINAENEIWASWRTEDVETYLALTEKFLREFQQKTKELKVKEKSYGKKGNSTL